MEEPLQQPITLEAEAAGLVMAPMVLIQSSVLVVLHHETEHKEENEEESATVPMVDSVVVAVPTTAVVAVVATPAVAEADGVHYILVEAEAPTMQEPTKVIPKDSMMDMVKYLSISCNYREFV